MKKIFKLAIALTTTSLFLSGCASMSKKFRNIPAGTMEKNLAQIKGKSPKEIAALFGEPISLGWNNKEQLADDKYYMTYVVGDGETSMGSFMLGGTNLTCRYFILYKEDGYKATGQPNNAFELPCANLQNKGWYTYDDSKIK